MPIHGILVEGDQYIDFVAHAAHRPVAGADCQERVTAANDRLIRVVGIEVQAAARENACQDVSCAGNALTVFAPDTDCKINGCHRSNFKHRRAQGFGGRPVSNDCPSVRYVKQNHQFGIEPTKK